MDNIFTYAYLQAVQVDFLTSFQERLMYARAIRDAIEWHDANSNKPFIDNNNKN